MTRDEIEDRAVTAINRLLMATGLDLSAERKAGILISLRGTGVTIVQIETACHRLAICQKFDEKIRYGATLTSADIFGKIGELGAASTVGVDPVRAMISKPVQIGNLLPPETGRKELPAGDRE